MYPLTICSHNRVIIATEDWFSKHGVRSINFSLRTLRINSNRVGEAGLSWFIDANGSFHSLDWIGFERTTFLQAIRLKRRVERYSIAAPRQITIGELANLTAHLSEAFAEAPNSAEIRNLLSSRSQSEIVSRDFMREYLGE